MKVSHSDSGGRASFQLSRQEVTYFDTFGFLVIPELFKDDAEEIAGAFEEVFEKERDDYWELRAYLHGGERRVVIPGFIDKHEALGRLRHDPRVLAVVNALVGERHEYAESDGNLWYCETYWHTDVYGSPVSQLHVKLSFYLDSLRADNGAIRVIPGTHHYQETFAKTLQRDLANPATIRDTLGVEGESIPSWTLESEPGDLIVWNQRTVHASYCGHGRRRSFAITFREAGDWKQAAG